MHLLTTLPLAVIAEILHQTSGMEAPQAGPASGSLAFFLVGLITGIVGAVAFFFIYIHLIRPAQGHLPPADGSDLAENADVKEEEENTPGTHPPRPHQQEQQRRGAPWERPDDWWKDPG